MCLVEKGCVVGVALCFSSTIVFAENYQHEVSLSYALSDTELYSVGDYRTNSDMDVYLGRYQYYWSPVDLIGVPLAEAAFMRRSTGLALLVGRYSSRSDSSGVFSGRLDLSSRLSYLDASYNVSNDMLIGMSYEYIDTDFESSSQADQSVSLNAGYYIGEFTMLGFVITRDKEEDYGGVGSYSSSYTLQAKSVLELPSHKFLALDVLIINNDSSEEYDYKVLLLGAMFYFGIDTGIGGGYTQVFDEGDGVVRADSYSLNISHFFTNKFSVSLSAHRAKANTNDFKYENDVFSIELTKRF